MRTTTETELLDAIRRDPSDLHAVRVYADWLLDRDDSRGELVMLQQREDELDADQIERLLRLAAEHGFQRIPDDPEGDVLRFAGGVVQHGPFLIVYAVALRGQTYRVTESRTELRIEVDTEVVRTDTARGMIAPQGANVVLSSVSAAIAAGLPLDRFELPTAIEKHPRGRIGRFPTDPVPDDLAARWQPGRRHIDFRDLQRWRALATRWHALR